MVNGERIFLRELCISCGRCAEDCYAEALAIAGKWMTVREVMDEVIKDKPFYENSGGGVTLSGGEPLLQAGFVRELLEESKREGLHTAVDTAGNVPWEAFESVLPFVDLFLYDVKVADEELHRQVTGVSNTRILDNLKRLAGKGTTILIRIPVIPGVNDTPEEMERIGLLIKDLDNIEYADLLPFHGLGESKYASLGMEYKAKGYQPPEPELMDSLAEILGEMDIRVKIGRK